MDLATANKRIGTVVTVRLPRWLRAQEAALADQREAAATLKRLYVDGTVPMAVVAFKARRVKAWHAVRVRDVK